MGSFHQISDMFLMNLIFAVSSVTVSVQSLSCSDYVVNTCYDPPATEALHARSLDECKQNCYLFASFDECTFFTYTDFNIDENCKLFEASLQSWLDTCNIHGQPVKDKNGRGFAKFDCGFIDGGHPVETIDESLSFEECQIRCIEASTNYMLYYHEEALCECYPAGERSCASRAVEDWVDIDDCPSYNQEI